MSVSEIAPGKNVPIKIWAGIGGLVLAFEIYVIMKWVTGPYFTPVKVGPSEVPQWMMLCLRTMEIGFVVLWLWCIWHFIVQPWRKERRVIFDGLFLMTMPTYGWIHDGFCDYGGMIFTYNSALFNMGSWVNEMPGALIPGKPGAQLSEPLWAAAVYPSVIFLLTIAGCSFMREVKKRRPQIRPLGLIISAWFCMILCDIVVEGVIMMPLGTHTYAGAPDWACINVDKYYKYPLIEGFCFGAVWVCWSALRYFKDDRGYSVVERGVDDLKISLWQKTGLRFLAIGGFVSVTMTATVVIPFYWMATHMSPYPEDVMKRSYFTQGLCGDGTNTACPGPALPLPRGNVSARVTPNGELFIPEGTKLPEFVPFDKGPLGPEGD